jgi:uncharacterized protein (TIGR02284 family)
MRIRRASRNKLRRSDISKPRLFATGERRRHTVQCDHVRLMALTKQGQHADRAAVLAATEGFAMTREDVIATLNSLIQTSKDGEQGFGTCASTVKSSHIKEFCERKAEQCRIGAAQLQAIVREMGGDADSAGSTSGALHRAWLDFRTNVTGMDDAAVLRECERGENAARKAYEEALRQALPGDIRVVVERQFREVKANHERIGELRAATA